MRLALAALLLCLMATPAFDRDDGRYAASDPVVRQWFKSQKSPKTGWPCCDESDGTYVEEDIREGHYWAKGGPFQEWTPVPDDVVIHDANRNGSPVLWWRWDDGKPQVYCYAPGGGV